MSDDRKDLPPASSPTFDERVRETLSTYLGNRGNKLDRGLTIRDLVDAGIIKLRNGFLSGAGGSGNPVSGPGAAASDAYQVDLTPPPPPEGLAATTSGQSIQVTINPQTYRQGHGPAKVTVFGAKYLITDPLPTYANAAVLSEFSGDVHAFPVDSGSLYRIWAKSVSADGVESSVAGGTNGVAPVTGLLNDASIASLTADRIRSGSITVGQFIQASNYLANTSGWRINGDGTAELANAIVRGGVYASYGQIGGITIASNAIRAGQTDFNIGTGFYLGANGNFSLGNAAGSRLTWNGSTLYVDGTLAVNTVSTANIVGGAVSAVEVFTEVHTGTTASVAVPHAFTMAFAGTVHVVASAQSYSTAFGADDSSTCDLIINGASQQTATRSGAAVAAPDVLIASAFCNAGANNVQVNMTWANIDNVGGTTKILRILVLKTYR